MKCVIDILDKVRAEIEQLPTTRCTETHWIYTDADDFKENVLAIIDHYKSESEEYVNFADDLIPIMDEAESEV